MQLTFTGTGTSQGVPVIGCRCEVCQSADPRDQRLRTAALLHAAGKYLAIDLGPDFRQQMLRAQPPRLDGVLLTHEHNDHVAGLDDVRPYNFMQRQDMPIFCTSQVGDSLRQRFAYAFSDNPYPGAPVIRLHHIHKDRPFTALGVEVQPIEVWHGQLPVLGFRVGNLAYLTDVHTIADDELTKLQNLDVLVVSALYRASHPHHSHLNLPQALELIARINPQRAFLTHLSHHIGLHAEVEASLPANVRIAYDGLEVTAED